MKTHEAEKSNKMIWWVTSTEVKRTVKAKTTPRHSETMLSSHSTIIIMRPNQICMAMVDMLIEIILIGDQTSIMSNLSGQAMIDIPLTIELPTILKNINLWMLIRVCKTTQDTLILITPQAHMMNLMNSWRKENSLNRHTPFQFIHQRLHTYSTILYMSPKVIKDQSITTLMMQQSTISINRWSIRLITVMLSTLKKIMILLGIQ